MSVAGLVCSKQQPTREDVSVESVAFGAEKENRNISGVVVLQYGGITRVLFFFF